MEFLIKRLYYHNNKLISGFYKKGIFTNYIVEDLGKGSFHKLHKNGTQSMVQFFSIKRGCIVYGIKEVVFDKVNYITLQENGDIKTKDKLKFTYKVNTKRLHINFL